MELLHTQPFEMIENIRRRLNKMLNETTFDPTFDPVPADLLVRKDFDKIDKSTKINWVPRADLKEEDDKFILKVDLPGIPPQQITLSTQDGLLSICGRTENQAHSEKDNYLKVERYSGRFLREFSLPANSQAEKIEARLQHGTLEIFIPKGSNSTAKQIEIKTED